MKENTGLVESPDTNSTSIAPEFMTHDDQTRYLVMKLFELKAIIKSKDTSPLKREMARKKYKKLLLNIVKGRT